MSAFLHSLKKAFFFWQKGSILGIDIGSSSIKVVLIEKVEEKIFLRNYGELILGPSAELSAGQATNLSSEKISGELSLLLKELKISPTRTFITIPVSASLLSVAELPAVSENEMKSMVPIEARKYIPVPLNEVSLDWWVLPEHLPVKDTPKTEGEPAIAEKVEVIIAAIHNEVVKKYESIKDNAHIPGAPAQFEIEIFSALRAIATKDMPTSLFIDMGALTTKFALVDGGVIHASHVTAVGGQDITAGLARSQGITFDAAETMKCTFGTVGDNEGRDVLAVAELLMANIMNEAIRFVEGYEMRHNRKISKVILAGGASKLLGVEKIINKTFPTAVVERGFPFSNIDAPAFLSETLKSVGPNYATALGVALKGLE